MISLIWLAVGATAAIGVKAALDGKTERSCHNCSSFDKHAWEHRHLNKDGNEVAAEMDTYKIYCPKTNKEYRIESREDIEKKMLCGKEYNHRYR